ncbi:ficolin-2-like [Drosophila innubila]|uniref:ficolin-2-like n=1 Tax=Drosophila innubila TaxID=198719 RepID=UPI00148CEAA5|nr:ficolin-2-like [Drosophila innubila]
MRISIFYKSIILILAINVLNATASQEDISCKVNRELEQQCGSYTYVVVKPFLDYIKQINDEINQNKIKDREINDLKEKLIQQNSNVAINNVLKAQIDFQQTTINRLTTSAISTDQCDQIKKELIDKDEMIAELRVKAKTDTDNLRATQLQLEENLIKLAKQKTDLQLCQKEVEKFSKTEKNQKPNSCNAFGDSSGIHQIQVPGIDSFDVLCDNQTAGPGWIVIEQRLNGGESFNRDWATFRKGFGSHDGDFFLGLEKIHRLTNNQYNELYIYMERFDGRIDYARYDRFGISNENDKYRINILGEFSGNVEDKLRSHAYMMFSTSDSDNDAWAEGSCAHYREAGWWYESCVTSFLHGAYYNRATDSYSSIYFNYPHTIKKLKIMIRPISKN